ncbi:MAG: ATPase domain-containing protein [Candidatus Bathyarchaeia archaeon]
MSLISSYFDVSGNAVMSFIKGSSILLAGAPGTGKTVFSTQFVVNGVKVGEPGVYVTFTEPKAFFIENLSRQLGVDLKKFEDEGKLKILDMTALGGGGVSVLLDAIIDSVESLSAKRLAIDSFSALTNVIRDTSEVRELIHTVLGRIVRGMDCTTIITLERTIGRDGSYYGMEEFIADTVIILHKRFIEGRVLREMEILKNRGTGIARPLIPYTLHGGFKAFDPYMEWMEKEPSGFKPVKRRVGFLSTGFEDLDCLLGGGLPQRSYSTLEVGSEVPLPILRILRPMIVNALNQGHGVFLLPPMGMSASQCRESIKPYIKTDILDSRMRIVDYGPEIKEPYCVRLEGANINGDFWQIWKTLEQLRDATGRSVLSVIGFDTVEYIYGLDEGLKILGFDLSTIRNMGDIRVNLIRPSAKMRAQLVEASDIYIILDEVYGSLILYGLKPRTPIYNLDISYRDGVMESMLIQMA